MEEEEEEEEEEKEEEEEVGGAEGAEEEEEDDGAVCVSQNKNMQHALNDNAENDDDGEEAEDVPVKNVEVARRAASKRRAPELSDKPPQLTKPAEYQRRPGEHQHLSASLPARGLGAKFRFLSRRRLMMTKVESADVAKNPLIPSSTRPMWQARCYQQS